MGPRRVKAGVQWRSGRIRLSPKKMGDLRSLVFLRAMSQCERIIDGKRCGRVAYWDWESWNGGELHHVIHRSQGGSDTEENCEWWCRQCHWDHHNGTLDGRFKR